MSKTTSQTTKRMRALFDTILAGAADATDEAEQARQVYADCIEELGDPASIARAQFIRAQCEVARNPRWDLRAIEAKRRALALEREHGATWRRELPVIPGVTWGAFERGFIAGVVVETVDVLHAHGAAIAAAAPVTRVELAASVGPDPAPLVEPEPAPAGGWPWLRTLVVAGGEEKQFHAERSIVDLVPELEISDPDALEVFEWLANRKHVVPLRRLATTGSHTSGAALARRLDHAYAAHLQELALGTKFVDFDTGYYDDPTMRAAGAAALAANRFAKVEVLDVDLQRVTDAGLRALLATLPKLRELSARRCELRQLDFLAQSEGALLRFLDLGANQLGSAGAIEVARAPRLAQLEVLRLDGCEVGQHGLEAIVHGKAWDTLRILELSRNPLALAGAISLAGAPHPAHLHTLKVANCDLTFEATRVLAGAAWLAQLFEVDLAKNELAPELLAAIAGVRVVGLASCALGPAVAPRLGGLWQHARDLDLSNNPLGGAGVTALVASPASSLVSLSLAGCELDDAALEALAGARCEQLQVLSLANNPSITTAGLRRLFRSKALPALRSLDLSDCKLTDDVIPLLVERCKDFARLDVREHDWSDEGLLAMAAAMDDLRITSFKTSGSPWTLPDDEKREFLLAKFGPGWWYTQWSGAEYGANYEPDAVYPDDLPF